MVQLRSKPNEHEESQEKKAVYQQLLEPGQQQQQVEAFALRVLKYQLRAVQRANLLVPAPIVPGVKLCFEELLFVSKERYATQEQGL